MTAVAPDPALEILVRESDGFSVWNGPPFSDALQPTAKREKQLCGGAKFSEDGRRLLVSRQDGVVSIFDCKGYKEIKSYELPNLVNAALSPCGTYLQTFQRPSSPQDKNVNLWKIDTGDSVYAFSQKNTTKATWYICSYVKDPTKGFLPCFKCFFCPTRPAIFFSRDEAVACRLATNEIQFFDPASFDRGIVSRIKIPGVAAIELSQQSGSLVAAFVPESKGAPATVQIFPRENNGNAQPLARRSFFRCSRAQLHWNHGSHGLLVVAQADVDKSNQSYYGESKLSYLTTDGVYEGLVPLKKEGPVHDVQWSYSGSEFAVVYGFMPARATVFDKKCNPLLELGSGPYNTIRWNPKGRFLCLAGFGNLPGEMPATYVLIGRFDLIGNHQNSSVFRLRVFWDYVEKKQIGATKAEWSVTSEWAPNGCYFMCATTTPRLQVDNGIKIFHHDGSLYYKKMFDKLYQADWKPESADSFGDITELVKSMSSLKIQGTKSEGPGSKASQHPTLVPSQKPAAYRPPHAKNAAAVQAELFGGAAPVQEMSKAALRNKKKREKQREKKAAEGSSAGDASQD
ncbi:Eukaryotic translation initiation factor 2A-like protein [Drosera capensis]